MIAGSAHVGFVVAAYAAAALVFVGLVAWLILDGRRLNARLVALEARGIRRRSAEPGAAE
jgi:heme exporter protein D